MRKTWGCLTAIAIAAAGMSIAVVPGAQAVAKLCNGLKPTIVGTDKGETIRGTPGNDVIAGGGGDDVIYGGGGNDTICGDYGNDEIFGGRGNDKIFGGEGDDYMAGGGGGDLIDGGNHVMIDGDVVTYASASWGVRVVLHDGSGTGRIMAPGAPTDTLRNIQYIEGSNYGDRIDIRDNSHETVESLGGKDIIYGDARDRIDAGDKVDTCHYILHPPTMLNCETTVQDGGDVPFPW